eukprot:TRINITY_DN5321_c0_g1_i2.p1 TRINITY_DN5321_c0_g1~~TRINITY_DN5321_c0_g1_i2.p1  ORF type:complete len:370 (+),score=75.93 TRINITY_DN5321_c0_g1_i2:76-1185(+)
MLSCPSAVLFLFAVLMALREATVRKLEADDTHAFIALQDLFVQEHHELTKGIYEEVTLRDWQLSLLCPEHVMDKPNGRIEHVESMVKQEHECFQNLHIFVATLGTSNGHAAPFVGYIMYQVHRGCGNKKKRALDESPWPYVQVKQIFVCPEYRHRGFGKRLFETMIEALDEQQREDLQLSVLDLNTTATTWYRSQGFVVSGLTWEFLGKRKDFHVVVYQSMHRLLGLPAESLKQKTGNIFRFEVIGEVISIEYPDGSGTFDVRIVGWLERDGVHCVDSRGLSDSDVPRFTDLVDLTAYFRDGHVRFQRNLSLVMRDVEMTKHYVRQDKARIKKDLLQSRQDEQDASDEEVDNEDRQRRRRKHDGVFLSL